MNIDSVIRYFDLHSRSEMAEAQAKGSKTARLPDYWIAIYFFAAYLGVLARDVIAAQGFNIPTFEYIKLFVIVILIFPSVYKQVIDALDSAFVRACVSFAGGFGYQTLVEANNLSALTGQ